MWSLSLFISIHFDYTLNVSSSIIIKQAVNIMLVKLYCEMCLDPFFFTTIYYFALLLSEVENGKRQGQLRVALIVKKETFSQSLWSCGTAESWKHDLYQSCCNTWLEPRCTMWQSFDFMLTFAHKTVIFTTNLLLSNCKCCYKSGKSFFFFLSRFQDLELVQLLSREPDGRGLIDCNSCQSVVC